MRGDVQPGGNPISISTHSGLSATFSSRATTALIVTWTFDPSGRRPVGPAPRNPVRPPVAIDAVGVGHSRTATAKGLPFKRAPRAAARSVQDSGDSLRLKTPASGVGHCNTCEGRNGVRRRRSDGQSPRVTSDAFGVVHAVPRDDEDSLAAVGSTDLGSANSEPVRIIPSFGKLPEDGVEAPRREDGDILHDNETRSKVANDTSELKPEAAALIFEASTSPSRRHPLTRETSAEAVDFWGVEANVSHVFVDEGSGPVSGGDSSTPLVSFTLPDCFDIEPRVS